MKHRHINDKTWTKAAIYSLFERGELADWHEYLNTKDSEAEKNLMIVAKELHQETFAKAVIDSVNSNCFKNS
jgi:hypothetical protein